MWKLIGLMLGGDGTPREDNRGAPGMSRPKSIDQIGDEVGCVSLCILVGLLAVVITIALEICRWVWIAVAICLWVFWGV